ncbi:hypothetical protein PICMEDRAFT_18381 [Pichia membranifaciens NRRL Y-2026]|uniref:Uncharacterized protein n=1 Tax=Pichia membranifaciens NRRL Y-2026 TaxID=763406 RepID=A0A1E3NED6_9ASCO|nr:hypothetical protein PICMEDRAFT_18381 [Pichia membranifaciens NRRL Y-2026]ODQ44482.1 hypothetical protein PICMEDRAFT_18381 [Pichia membranifaciens NRRL Y-2026]
MSQRIPDLRSSVAASEDTVTLLQNRLSLVNANYTLSQSQSQSQSQASQSQLQNPDAERAQKLRVLALLRQLKTVPLKSVSSKTVPASLANCQLRTQTRQLSNTLSADVVASDLFICRSIAAMLESLLAALNASIADLQSQPSFRQQPDEIKASILLSKTDALKARARKLSSYIKVLVNDYLFGLEFSFLFKNLDEDSLKSRKQKFLKLLEVLLNNNILHPNSEHPTWVTLNSMDDPLVRFLLLNRMILVHPTIPNKIKLKDLSVDL